MEMMRFRIGRFLLVMGLRVLPRGRVQSELSSLFDVWSTKVYHQIDAALATPPQI